MDQESRVILQVVHAASIRYASCYSVSCMKTFVDVECRSGILLAVSSAIRDSRWEVVFWFER